MIALLLDHLPTSTNDPQQQPQVDDHLHRALLSHQLLPCLADPSRASRDFGGLHFSTPAALLQASSADHVLQSVHLALSLPHLTLSPRGNAHSVSGQSLAPPSGLALDLSALSSVDLDPSASSAWIGAGALWEDVLRICLRSANRSPRSWTDYLRLSVGGTLSCGGISGQAFRYGPQSCNVNELEVVTGRGDLLRCSAAVNPDLFHAVLGGLGQFAVIIRARIPVFPAPDMVRWVRVVYTCFEEFSADAESMVRRADDCNAVDYLEGFAFVNSPDPANGWPTVPILPRHHFDPSLVPAASDPLLYCLEFAVHYTSAAEADMRIQGMLCELRHVRGLEFAADDGYEEFLTRVNKAEEASRANGTWDAPHPWLNLLVSATDIVDFDRRVLKGVLKGGIGGPMLVYPLLKSKWIAETSLVAPDAEVFYLVALLRFSRPYPDGPRPEDLVAQNAEIVDCCAANGYDFKVYLPGYKEEGQWRAHFGKEWARFEERKARYDPMGILGPGQRIFPRKAHGPM